MTFDTLLEDVRSKVDAISSFPADAKNPVISKAQREEHSLWKQIFGDADRAALQKLANQLKNDLLANVSVSIAALLVGLVTWLILRQVSTPVSALGR